MRRGEGKAEITRPTDGLRDAHAGLPALTVLLSFQFCHFSDRGISHHEIIYATWVHQAALICGSRESSSDALGGAWLLYTEVEAGVRRSKAPFSEKMVRERRKKGP